LLISSFEEYNSVVLRLAAGVEMKVLIELDYLPLYVNFIAMIR